MVSCNLCPQEFKDNFNFSRHFKANHICKYYEKQFSDKDKMKSHRQHCSKREDLTNVCTHCNKQFEYKSSLKVHMATCSIRNKFVQDSTVFECNICWPNRTFSRSDALQNHLTTHDKTKIYNCSECPKSFSCPAFLSRHVKIHIKVFYCNLCSTQCKSKYSLKRHVEKKHNNNESVNNLKTDCKYCGKEYYHTDGLKRHIKNKHSEFQNLSNVQSEQNNFTEATDTKIIKPQLSCPFN